LYADGSALVMIEGADTAAILGAARRSHTMAETVATLRAMVGMPRGLADDSGRFVLTGCGDLPAAETFLLRSLIKPNEGFMSRHVERCIALAPPRRLCRTAITPNTITLVSLGIGLACAPFFLSASPRYQVAGALLFLSHSILDGCDGELARLKFLESRWGARLDIGGGKLGHTAPFIFLAGGWGAASGSSWALVLRARSVGA